MSALIWEIAWAWSGVRTETSNGSGCRRAGVPIRSAYALVTDGARYLLTRKRVRNSYWGGVLKTAGQNGHDQAVNNAGQFALPGGKVEAVEDNGNPVFTAMREMEEETGILLDSLHPARTQMVFLDPTAGHHGTAFAVVIFQVAPMALTNLSIQANQNLQPAALNPASPAGGGNPRMTCWEHDSVVLVNGANLAGSLGVRVPVADAHIAALIINNHHSQSITWYAAIADTVQNGGAVGYVSNGIARIA